MRRVTWGAGIVGSLVLGSMGVACSASDNGDGTELGSVSGDTGVTGSFESGTTGTDSDGDFAAGDGEFVAEEGETGDSGDGVGGAGGATEGGAPAKVASPQGHAPPSGQLTAGIFDDNLSFSFFEKYYQAMTQRQLDGRLPFEFKVHETAHAAEGEARGARSALDLLLLIDTTASMGDELDYLKSEFDALTATISDLYPNAEQRWSAVMYRDETDEYLTRSQDFTSDVDEFRTFLEAQSFDGGGDFPEAPDAGLMAANAQSWRGESEVAKLVFWVADAPHHTEKAQAMADAIVASQQKSIHIYPVASSGIDEVTEFSMRQSAQLTAGRYLFLTDDSGLGGSHAEPTLPCYYVSTLKSAILRGVQSEMSGERVKITAEDIVRFSGGLNVEDNCTIGDGFQATPF